MPVHPYKDKGLCLYMHIRTKAYACTSIILHNGIDNRHPILSMMRACISVKNRQSRARRFVWGRQNNCNAYACTQHVV